MNKAPVRGLVNNRTTDAEIHFDLSGPFQDNINKNTYALHFLDSKTAFSEAHAIPTKGNVSNHVRGFINKVKGKYGSAGISVQMIRADNARENIPKELHEFCITNGIKIEPSPAYAPESNGMAERLVQENCTRARVMMLATTLPANL